MNINWTQDLVDQVDWHWQHQLRPRFSGLTDAEYFWEPVGNSWSIRPRGEGRAALSVGAGDLVMDFAMPEPTPAPVTTIAWRLAHLIVGASLALVSPGTSADPRSTSRRSSTRAPQTRPCSSSTTSTQPG